MMATRGKPFQPGNTLGRGRPKGSSNKPKSPAQELLEEYHLALTRKCLSLAASGNLAAMRICMDRLAPPRPNGCIRISLPKIRTLQDVEMAADKIMQAMGRSRIMPAEGKTVTESLMLIAQMIGNTQMQTRIEKLEEEIGRKAI
jgi:hypothetical protein